MTFRIFEHAIGRFTPAGAWVVAHRGCGHGVGIHAVLTDDENSRMNRLGAEHPRALATNHGDDAVGDGEVYRTRAKNIDENSWQAPTFVPIRFRIEFRGHS